MLPLGWSQPRITAPAEVCPPVSEHVRRHVPSLVSARRVVDAVPPALDLLAEAAITTAS